MPVLDEIADRLVAQGVGVKGSNIFLGSNANIPSGDGPYLSLTETGGTGSRRTHNGTAVAQPTVQLLCRARSYSVARTMLRNAFLALGGDQGLHQVTLGATAYLSITPRQQPTDIGLDGQTRPMIVFNIDVMKQPS